MKTRAYSVSSLGRAALPWLALLLACSPNGAGGSKDGPVTQCTKAGVSCEFAPGKLGLCVERTTCNGADCFVCQSQH